MSKSQKSYSSDEDFVVGVMVFGVGALMALVGAAIIGEAVSKANEGAELEKESSVTEFLLSGPHSQKSNIHSK